MRSISLLIFVAITVSCNNFSLTTKKINDLKEYYSYINKPENGLIVTKKINGFEVSVKYLPVDYLVYTELKNTKHQTISDKTIDSLKNNYANSTTFLFSIGPDTKKNEDDIMFSGLTNYKEYTERVMTMNFEFENFVMLQKKNSQVSPILSSMENTYGLTKNRKIIFVFKGDVISENQGADFIYKDDMFELGILHFMFENNKLKNIPELEIKTILKS